MTPPDDGPPPGRWLHPQCGLVHGWNEVCPVPAESPLGRLFRVLNPSPGAGPDRLAAVSELRAWLDEQERQAVVVARIDGATWGDIAEAAGLGRLEAFSRWGPLIRQMEDAGMLPPSPPAPAPAPPVEPLWAERRDVPWCRWCGHRLVITRWGWAHAAAAGGPDDGLDDACPGPQPWPARDHWPV